MRARFGVRLKWFEGPGGKTASLYLEIAPQSATSEYGLRCLARSRPWRPRRSPRFAMISGVALSGSGLCDCRGHRRCRPVSNASKLLSRGPVVVYLFIELSLDWRQTALGSILSHTQKRVVKDMILIFGFH